MISPRDHEKTRETTREITLHSRKLKKTQEQIHAAPKKNQVKTRKKFTLHREKPRETENVSCYSTYNYPFHIYIVTISTGYHYVIVTCRLAHANFMQQTEYCIYA